MPRTTFPRDRFDDLPTDAGRFGAHRAENPRVRAWAVLLWTVIATVVLVAVGIVGTLAVTGRIVLVPTPEPTVAALPAARWQAVVIGLDRTTNPPVDSPAS